MYFKQSDLFWHLDHDFIKKIMDRSSKQQHEAGHVLFHQGDPALHFYVLIKGRVRLIMGDNGQVAHTVSHAGECFGWSSLLDRTAYSASAECRKSTELMVIDAIAFKHIIENDSVNGLRFMKQLAGMVGNRLIQNYQMVSSMGSVDSILSYGSNQVSEVVPDAQ